MKTTLLSLAILLALSTAVVAADPTLSVAGSGKPGTTLVFTVSGANPDPNTVAFLGISPAPGKTVFPFVTMDLAMPIWASGMGSLRQGSHSHKIQVPADWPPGLVIPLWAQSVVITPKGGGIQATTTNVVKFLVRG